MGITRLFDKENNGTCDRLTLTHAVQRLMFWSEAGRYAYKDDGIVFIFNFFNKLKIFTITSVSPLLLFKYAVKWL